MRSTLLTLMAAAVGTQVSGQELPLPTLDVIRSDNVTYRFTDNYHAEWYTFDDGSGQLTLRVSLKLLNYDYSSWTATDGSFGHWLSIGFGKNQMPGADIIMCVFRYRGTTSDDKFVCFDRFANQRSMPIDDETQSVTDVDTLRSYDERLKKVSLTAVFDRPLAGDGSTSE